jgi:hypothetical protein
LVRWLLLPLLLCAALARGEDARPARQDTLSLQQGRAALWRSVALDGWGQAYNGEWLKALVFSGAELAIVASAYGQHRQFRDNDRLRRNATETDVQDYYATRADFYLRDRNKILWWWLWLKLGCTLDAYVSGSLSNFDAGWGEELGLQPVLLGSGTPGVRVTLPLSGFGSSARTRGSEK